MSQLATFIGIACESNSKDLSEISDQTYYDYLIPSKEITEEHVICPRCDQEFTLNNIPFREQSQIQRFFLIIFVTSPIWLFLSALIALITMQQNSDLSLIIFAILLVFPISSLIFVLYINSNEDVISRAIRGKNTKIKLKLSERGHQKYSHTLANTLFYPQVCTRDVVITSTVKSLNVGIKCVASTESTTKSFFDAAGSRVKYVVAPLTLQIGGTIPPNRIKKIICPVCGRIVILKISGESITIHMPERTVALGVNYAIDTHEITTL